MSWNSWKDPTADQWAADAIDKDKLQRLGASKYETGHSAEGAISLLKAGQGTDQFKIEDISL